MTFHSRFPVYFLFFFLGSLALKGIPVRGCILAGDSTAAAKGWDRIKANDNLGARKLFISELHKDSLSEEALEGLLYLSDIEQDKLDYKKYANRLLSQPVPEAVFAIFKNAWAGSLDFILSKKNISEGSKFPYRLAAAAVLKEKRRFAESDAAVGALLGDYHWALIGPFKNVSGSGHDIPFPVEQEAYDSTKTYSNSLNIPLKWVRPTYYDKGDKIEFSRHLLSCYSSATYYANCFVNLSESRTVQLRLGSSSPVKVWLDNILVFDGKRISRFQWDGEIITLQIEAGPHRILLKCSSPGAAPKSSDLFSFYDSPELSDDESNELSFALRITMPDGKLLSPKILYPCASPPFPGGAGRLPVDSALLQENPGISYFKTEIEKHPDELFGYYGLCKAYFLAGLSREAEPYFVKAWRNNKKTVLLKYLCAKIYAQNGKMEKAYEVLSDIDPEKTPVFSLLYSQFSEIDPGTEPRKYLSTLDRLKALCPSNYSVISAYINFYDKRGMQKEKETFILEMKKSFPEYSETLDAELDTDKPDKDLTDQDRTQGIKQTISKRGFRFSTLDYSTAIAWYKNKGRSAKVLGLYDELIKRLPWEVEYRQNKGKYLFELGRHQEALQELSGALGISPYNTTTLECMGDIYADKSPRNSLSSDARALEYYKLAKKYQIDLAGIDSKISRIEGQKRLNKLFSDKTFEEVLADPAWKARYIPRGNGKNSGAFKDAGTSDDAVILLYTRDLIYDSSAHVEVYQQLMIKILTAAGVRHWTEYDYSFMGNMNTLRVLKPNGTVISPDKQGSYVVIKNLEPGDLIQIDGVQEWEQQTELDQELVFTHYISFEAPVFYHKFEVALPAGKYLGYRYHKLDSTLKKTSHDGFDFYNWEYTNIPKIETEEAVPDVFDLYGSIMISTMPDWSKLCEWYTQTTYGKLEMSYEIQEALDSIVHPQMNQQEKAEAIYNYLTREINYSYVPFLQSGYVPKDPGLTLSSRIGDCKDVATLMIVMLKAIGLEAQYTLVKSNAFNHQEVLPSLYFDHVVVRYELEGRQHFLDMTTDFYPWYVLTENDVSAWALIIRKGETAFLLPADDLDTAKNKIQYAIDARLNTDRTIDLSVDAVYPGIAGGSLREYFSGITQQEQKNYLSGRLGKGVFTDMSMKASLSLKAAGFSDEAANLLIFQIPYMSAVQSSVAVSGKYRHNRIDLEKLGNSEPTVQKIRLSFPKNYHLLKLPENINYQSKFGSYKVSFQKNGDGMAIVKELDFHQRIIPVNEFDDFRTFYLKILNFDKTRIAIQQM
jgi:tetratricopeptide (TPR) repeat protein